MGAIIKPEGVVLGEKVDLRPEECVRLNPSRLTELYVELGHRAAENVIGRAMEELAVRLGEIEAAYWESDFAQVGKRARSIIAIADQVGLNGLSLAARHVTVTAKQDAPTAIAATVARLVRMGDNSLTAVWDARDMSV
ncbi:hypothetical protein ACFE33_02175 [Falsihalocynthiibacter sp. SS001]|uniref:hypothetical protein n=1 Tax=Falsihalocynthiibacter sp. SS001 TaxID=3349698 RepID=UPI0036D2344F